MWIAAVQGECRFPFAAYDILADPKKRQAYDSVDPEFSDEIPSINAQSKENFFEVFGPVFERNSRYSPHVMDIQHMCSVNL